jgi:thiamine pyrophosphokinase
MATVPAPRPVVTERLLAAIGVALTIPFLAREALDLAYMAVGMKPLSTYGAAASITVRAGLSDERLDPPLVDAAAELEAALVEAGWWIGAVETERWRGTGLVAVDAAAIETLHTALDAPAESAERLIGAALGYPATAAHGHATGELLPPHELPAHLRPYAVFTPSPDPADLAFIGEARRRIETVFAVALPARPPRRALVILDGERPAVHALDRVDPTWRSNEIVIAADGGARHAASLGLKLDLIAGDFDSLSGEEADAFERDGVRLEPRPASFDATDGEFAISLARREAEIVRVIAWRGGRLDAELATLSLLATLPSAAVELLAATGRVRLLRAPRDPLFAHLGVRLLLDGSPERLLSLLPSGGPATLSLSGLRYSGDHLEIAEGSSRGASNETTGEPAAIELHAGSLLVVESAAT